MPTDFSTTVVLPQGELTVSVRNGSISCWYKGYLPREMARELAREYTDSIGSVLKGVPGASDVPDSPGE